MTGTRTIIKQYCLLFMSIMCAGIVVSCAAAPKAVIDTRPVYPQRLEALVDECIREYPGISWIKIEEYEKRRQREAWIIVDVRSVIERAFSFIPGSLSIDAFESHMDKHEHKNILVYCTVGCRSGAYAMKLQQKGYKVFDLWGGVLAWAWAGKEYVTPGGIRTRSVHIYGGKWDVLPPDYEGGW